MRGTLRPTVLILVLLCSLTPALAQIEDYDPFVRCITTAEAPFLRAEGLSERVGEIRLDCTGGNPNEVKIFNIFVLINAPLTSDLTDPEEDETETLLLIDDPLPGVENRSNEVIYQGQVKGQPGVQPGNPGDPGAVDSGNVYPGFRAPASINRIEWNGIPFRPAPPGRSRVLRIVNLRVDTSGLQSSTNDPRPISASLGVAIPNSIPIGNNQAVVGFVQPSYTVEHRLEGAAFELLVEETYPESFRKRIANDVAGIGDIRQQGMIDNPYFTESGFTPDYTGLGLKAPGVADTGTRFLARLDDIPAGVYLTVPPRIIGENREGETPELELRRVLEFAPDYSGGVLVDEDAPTELVPVESGVAKILYEVVARPPYRDMTGKNHHDRFRIPLRLLFAQPTDIGTPTVLLTQVPLDDTRTMSQPAPEPRFYNDNPGVFLPVAGGAIRDYVSLRYTPSDDVPVLREYELPTGEAVSDSIMVIDGDDWLTVAPEDEETTEDILIAANPVGLAPGRYHGAFSLRLDGDEDGLVIVPVVLDVSPAPEIKVDLTPIHFRITVGAPAPPPRILFIGGLNKGFRFTLDSSTASGGNWLSVEPTSANTPANVRVTADAAGLIPGRYEGSISVQAAVASNTPQIVPVLLDVVPPLPMFDATSIGNAASYEANAVSPGEIVTIFGSNVGPDNPAGLELDELGTVAKIIGGTRILFDGTPGPMILASKTQSSCVVPYNIRGKTSVNVQIEVDGWVSEAVVVPVLATKPGIFTADSSGNGHGAILNEDGTLNSPSNPAKVGSVITAYLTGAGETQPAGFDGRINHGPDYPAPLAPALLRIGGIESQIEFLAGAPGMVNGAIQLNARTPATPGAQVPLQLILGSHTSNIVYVSIE